MDFSGQALAVFFLFSRQMSARISILRRGVMVCAIRHKLEEIAGRFPEGLGAPANLAGLEEAGPVSLVHGQSDELVPWKVCGQDL